MTGGFPPGSPLGRLLAGPVGPGRLLWIGVRPAHRAPVLAVAGAELVPGQGLRGDRYRGTGKATRQVTILSREGLDAIASFLGRGPVPPEALRRNLLVEGANLLALKGRRFRVGPALLEWTGECHPCSRMEEILGPGGYNAVRGQGGITARVLEGGVVRVGDAMRAEDDPGAMR